MPLTEVLILLALGLVAGALGGLLGIGGSVVMIPVLTLLLGHNQHLSQAAAMIVNFFVSAPAVLRHHAAQAVEWRIVRRMLPAGLVFIVIGVEVSNLLPGERLMHVFGVFLLYVIFVSFRKIVDGRQEGNGNGPRDNWFAATAVGGITGFAAGLLGVGGGIIAVPLLQRICHLPLRRSIACSAALMCVTSTIGAIRKNVALSGLTDLEGVPLEGTESLLIAVCLAPTALLGGHIGAGLTHTLPLRFVRIAFTILLCIAAAKFLGLV